MSIHVTEDMRKDIQSLQKLWCELGADDVIELAKKLVKEDLKYASLDKVLSCRLLDEALQLYFKKDELC